MNTALFTETVYEDSQEEMDYLAKRRDNIDKAKCVPAIEELGCETTRRTISVPVPEGEEEGGG
jgi:hypothetical protein